MNHFVDVKKFNFCLDYLYEEVQTLLVQKSSDYNPDGDVFKNVNEVSAFLNLKVEDIYLMFILTKVNRIKELLKNPHHEVNYESITDSLFDLVGYASLLTVYLHKDSWLEEYTDESQPEFPPDEIFQTEMIEEDTLDV